ncbi:alpha/beta hydrolase [Pelagibius sp.]|uniref:alpha/beta hydrolase n=1 Tax=Pelagibius sp. TaxID=1931238 RepID=UPI002609A568|nr:hypothetical protein [Pelagibius sp.]
MMHLRLINPKSARVLAFLFAASAWTAGQSAAKEIADTTARADGSRIHWALSNVAPDRPNRVVLIAQGSGCSPARSSPSVVMLAEILSDHAVLTVEKPGVAPADAPADGIEGCSDTYLENHTVSQRVADVMMVLGDLRERRLFDGDLVLFGGSEGGAVVSVLAHRAAEADAVVVLSTGTGLTMAEFLPLVAPPPAMEQMRTAFDGIRSDPNATGVLGGVSYDWWRDVLDRRFSDDLLKAGIPVLLIHGARDRSAPVEAARATRDAFVAAGQEHRLTYWEFETRDHAMVDPQGRSHMGEVLTQVRRWIDKRLPPPR